MKNEILLIPDKADIERDNIAKIWKENGGEVKRIGKFWVKPEVGNERVSIYGYDSFCLVLAQVLGIEMMMPKDEIIAALPKRHIKRKIEIVSLGAITNINFPKFIKSVTPKLFKAEIFVSEEALTSQVNDIEVTELLICSDVIGVDKEVRSFILNREIQDLAFYEGSGDINEARAFIEEFMETCDLELPKTFVLDIGFNEDDKWFVIEFNSSWGAGLNFCDPQKVIHCIREATINQAK